MTYDESKKKIARSVLAFSALSILACTTSSINALAREREESVTEQEDFAAARSLFDQYKKLDKACDASLVELYAPGAKIESEVERKDTPTQKEVYDREKFCGLITKTFADPVMAKMSAATEYDKPSFKLEGLVKKSVEVEFHAYSGETAMKVKWIVRKMPTGQWKIVKENALTYRKSVGPQVRN